MAKHYVPQSHLRRFQVDGRPGLVWMYDKVDGSFRQLPIKIVAQDRHYYSDEVEAELANHIEGPGCAIIEKVMRKEWLSDEERIQFSVYLMTMLSRGPRARRKNVERYPAVAREVMDDFESRIQHWIDATQPQEALASRKLQEVKDVREKYSENIPEQVQAQIQRPFISPKTVACIYRMKWHIATATNGMNFVTSDTPAHYDEGRGLSHSLTEFTLTLSNTVAFVGNHRNAKGIAYHNPRPYAVREINRRIISNTERFVFSNLNEDWIKVLASSTHHQFNSMMW